MGKKQNKTYLFWITSNRGTDDKVVVSVPSTWSKSELEYELERWCSAHGAWTSSESIVQYGYRSVKVPPKKELARQYKIACERKNKAVEKWRVLAEMFNIRQLGN